MNIGYGYGVSGLFLKVSTSLNGYNSKKDSSTIPKKYYQSSASLNLHQFLHSCSYIIPIYYMHEIIPQLILKANLYPTISSTSNSQAQPKAASLKIYLPIN